VTLATAGHKSLSDESGIDWQVYPPAMSDEDVLSDWDSAFNGGPGRSFTNSPCLRRTGTRVLVTQFIGLDI
jgi:hypothetical protein